MNEVEALTCVDLVIETLVEWGVISQDKYDSMTEDQRQELAALVADKSKE